MESQPLSVLDIPNTKSMLTMSHDLSRIAMAVTTLYSVFSALRAGKFYICWRTFLHLSSSLANNTNFSVAQMFFHGWNLHRIPHYVFPLKGFLS
jgi:hypothetical protein